MEVIINYFLNFEHKEVGVLKSSLWYQLGATRRACRNGHDFLGSASYVCALPDWRRAKETMAFLQNAEACIGRIVNGNLGGAGKVEMP